MPPPSPTADSPLVGDSVHQLVRLLQCGRKSCGYVLLEDEREWRRDDERRKTAVCPKCGNDDFYTLNEKGQQITTRDTEKYRNGLDPSTIAPTPRMGPKLRSALLAVKRRATATDETVADARKRLMKCLRHTSPIKCCGTPMLHGGIELGQAPITACMTCGKGLPLEIAAECGIRANVQGQTPEGAARRLSGPIGSTPIL